MADTLAPRGVTGVMTPAMNTVVQPELEMVRPDGVTNQMQRFRLGGERISEDPIPDLRELLAGHAGRQLRVASVPGSRPSRRSHPITYRHPGAFWPAHAQERMDYFRRLAGVPDDFAHQLFPDSVDDIAEVLDEAVAHVPLLAETGVQRFVNGPDADLSAVAATGRRVPEPLNERFESPAGRLVRATDPALPFRSYRPILPNADKVPRSRAMTDAGVRCTRSFLSVVCLGAALGLFGTAVPAEADDDSAGSLTADLGRIDFPDSGAPEAQAAFLTGMKALHSFEFEDAGEAFREARTIDPEFALAYWGEALSYNHPLWSEQDRLAAHTALAGYASTPEDRAARTSAGRERGLMEAVDVLYGSGDKLSRDIAYSEAMRHLHEDYPEDDEIATLYALSLLGTVRRGDKGFSRQVRAGAIALEVFARNPKHPGAAHFIIHAFDDPEYAILALPAAKAYAEIAPAAPHALHMPSHIFVQLGMWEGVVASNEASYEAALEHVKRKGLARGRSEFHALQWYHYGQLQLGNEERAQWALDEAFRTLERFPGKRVRRGTMRMLARHTLETQRWSEFDHGILTDADRRQAALQLAAGLSATYTDKPEAAEVALANIRDARKRLEGAASRAWRARIVAIEQMELEAALASARGDDDAAEAFLVEATALEAELNAPSGPPSPMKPAHEMYGEFLLARGRMEEAAVQFKRALERTPNRTRSVRGLERARRHSSDVSLLQ